MQKIIRDAKERIQSKENRAKLKVTRKRYVHNEVRKAWLQPGLQRKRERAVFGFISWSGAAVFASNRVAWRLRISSPIPTGGYDDDDNNGDDDDDVDDDDDDDDDDEPN